jgi:DNA-binding CsgD family transcriptional regulator
MTLIGNRTSSTCDLAPSTPGIGPATEVIGRDEELAAIDRFLATRSTRALALQGPAGIGKTSLWSAAVARARARGRQVLCARPAAVEAHLSFSVLGDLVTNVSRQAFEGLPELHRHALAVALNRDSSAALAGPSGALAVAVLGLVRACAAEAPLLLAIDDLQWADEASAGVLVYAFRRLGVDDVCVLVSCRGEAGVPLPFGLDGALGEEALERLDLEPLSEGAIRRILHRRLDLVLSRSELHALYVASGGNPFFALELGRAGVEPDEFGFLRLPHRLTELVSAQLARLPESARETLLVVAAAAAPDLPLLVRANADDGLKAALDAGVLEVDRGCVRIAHPLLASTVWMGVDDDRRREIHRALAAAVEDTEQRAHHLAQATEPPDEEVAVLLEHAAIQARARGAPAAAADLLERSRSFIPPGDVDEWARLGALLTAVEAEAGHWDRVSEHVREAQRRLPAGPRRAAILVAAAEMQPGLDTLFRQAIEEAGDSALGLRARIGLALQAGLAGRWGESVAIASETASLARRKNERALLGVALTFAGGLKLLDSRLDGSDELAEALAIEADLGRLPTSVFESPRMWQASALLWGGDPDRARTIFADLLALASERGEDVSVFQLRQVMILTELRAGDWRTARAVGHAAVDQLELLDYPFGRPIVEGLLASIDAREGDLASARALGTDAVAALAAAGDRLWSTFAHGALLLAELSAGDAGAAVVHADAIGEFFPGAGECWWSNHQGDELEALVLAGEHERARVCARRLREAGIRLELPRFLAWAARGEALLAAAAGDLGAAEAAVEIALSQHERFTDPFERARTLLVQGNVLRRRNRRRAARVSLGEAVAELDRLGARPFADAARAELKHMGGRTASGEHTLTGAEERVARLVAAGLSNRQVAARLYVTVSTVEAALTRVYRKLEVGSRVQLARALRDEEPSD